jgi:hypothetical protein
LNQYHFHLLLMIDINVDKQEKTLQNKTKLFQNFQFNKHLLISIEHPNQI